MSDTPGDSLETDGPSVFAARSTGRFASKAPPSSSLSASRKDYHLGIGLLIIVVILWTSSNFLTQALFEKGYQKPFLVTYLNTSGFSLYLLPYCIRTIRGHFRGGTNAGDIQRAIDEEFRPLVEDLEIDEDSPSEFRHPSMSEVRLSTEDCTPLTTQDTAKLALHFCIFWFIANWSVNASLDFTSVPSATILSSTSGFFTLGIGSILGVEVITNWKIGSVLMSFCGVFLVSISDLSKPALTHPTSTHPPKNTASFSNPIIGDTLALLSAIFYAIYVVLLKVRIRFESRIDMQLFFGFVGVFTVLTCWPIGILLHLARIEPFELPTSRMAITTILINTAVCLSSDYIYVLAMLKTTPLLVTVGLSLTIPLALLGDLLLGRTTRVQALIGAMLVLVSFVVVGVENAKPLKKRVNISEDGESLSRAYVEE